MAIMVRLATRADLECIGEFNRLLALETEGKALDMDILRAGIVALFGDAQKGVYYLAHEGERVLGQVGLTYEWSDWRNGWFWWLQSVYVRAEARRRGIFRILTEHIMEEARRQGDVAGIRLYVEANNAIAQATYRDMGMELTSYQVMERFPL